MGLAPWLNPTEDRAWRRYRQMSRLLEARLARDLERTSGLSDPDYDVLTVLAERRDHGWRANDLAQRLHWSTSRLSHHVGRMQRRGLVERQHDDRGAVVGVTTEGLSAIWRATPDHARCVREHFIDLLSAEQLESLDAIAEAVTTHLATASEHRAAAESAPKVNPR